MAIPNIRIKFQIDQSFRKDFHRLADDMQKKIARSAVRAALKPIETNLKAELLANAQHARLQSEENGGIVSIDPQSTGATLRAVRSKLASSKRARHRFYGVVGVDKNHIEYLNTNVRPMDSSNGRYQQIYTGKVRGLGKHGTITYYRSKSAQPREVMTYSKRKFGVRPDSMKNKNRYKRPSKYWHIFLRGARGVDSRGKWAGKRKHNWSGNDLLLKVVTRHRATALFIFHQKIAEGIKQATK